jgi:hypothetical protein
MDNLQHFDISRVWIMIREKLETAGDMLFSCNNNNLGHIRIYSIQELSGIFVEFSSRDIKKWYRIRIKGKG